MMTKAIEANWKILAGVFAAFVVGGAAVAFTTHLSTEKEKKAQEAYFSVEKKLNDLKAKKAEPAATPDKKNEPVNYSEVKKDLEKVIADYPSSVAAQMAGLHLASVLVEEKNVDTALTTLQKVENKDKGLVNTLVQQQIGQLLADKDKCQDAINVWQKILDRKEAAFIHPELKLQQAICYSKINDLKKAEEILTNLSSQAAATENVNGSPTAKEAEKYLRLLQFKKVSGT
jgi:predicted negative regulator of RcsB-dependent stress response